MRLLFTRLAVLAFGAAVLGGCVYRPDIQQGNYLESKTVDQLTVGMTRTQVRYLLGTPMVPNLFDKDRWDYLFYFTHGRSKHVDQRQVIVHFKDDKVASFDTLNMGIGPPLPPEEGPSISKFPKI